VKKLPQGIKLCKTNPENSVSASPIVGCSISSHSFYCFSSMSFQTLSAHGFSVAFPSGTSVFSLMAHSSLERWETLINPGI
jgi:hypothetical protein